MQRFKDKTVIVTGGSSGIGKATATRFAQEGARVVIFDIADDLDSMANAIEGDVSARKLDIRDSAAVKQAIDAVAGEHGGIHVLHNNAGVAVMKSPTDHTDDDWDKVMRTNVDGMFYCSRAAIPHLEESGGCIVNTSSVSGLGGDWGMLAYNTSKGAISNFTRALALDLGAKGVRVNAVAPSLTDTPLAEGITGDEKLMDRFRDRMALQPPEQPEDIAAVVAFLASDDARMVTGAVVPVDGGVTASNGQPPIG
ncbi:SDR family NAD(P)-dependent oxidoreductase [Aurantiacibacter spongiae]|uniref:SDR family oxidoreductase n=1 Tax=Aurantiacibacter spongiae TaxID=2488860 RepID=A0A3N5CU86_9SPHN|nr:SDR family oxidoreductase [Aurantiacibacter spongiae]RPF70980.1 SDR family oxidoreductase [Aurantiacibacter spongiae]